MEDETGVSAGKLADRHGGDTGSRESSDLRELDEEKDEARWEQEEEA